MDILQPKFNKKKLKLKKKTVIKKKIKNKIKKIDGSVDEGNTTFFSCGNSAVTTKAFKTRQFYLSGDFDAIFFIKNIVSYV